MNSATPSPQAAMQQAFAQMHQASRQHMEVPAVLRKERLLRLQRMLQEHAPVLTAAVQADFGVRSVRMTQLADLQLLDSQLKQALRKLERWMRPQRVWTPWHLLPARARLQWQPLGVVGVISPWNYPLQLALAPAIAALAAGNRVMLKPSELTPHTSAQLAAVVEQFFAPDEMCVIQGDSYVSSQFAGLAFDHLVFTGSTAVGRRVAQAAALHLTPTTLELGGKSPCIVASDCDMELAALRIAHGKLFNAGQTCIAPDYLLLPRGQEAAFEQAYRKAVTQLYPRIEGNPDYTAIIHQRQYLRLRGLLQQALNQGAQVQWVASEAEMAQGKLWDAQPSRQMPPALVWNVQPDMALMQEEIFGPILPVLTYDHLDGAINAINAGPRPLALYWFGKDDAARDAVLHRTVSGGVTVNDTLMHVVHDNLPFGGVGDSGWGAYHGVHGFQRFSHCKPVVFQGKRSAIQWLYPPYGAQFDRLMRWVRRWH